MNWTVFVREVAGRSEPTFDKLQQALLVAAETNQEYELADEDPHEVLYGAPLSAIIGFAWYGSVFSGGGDSLCLELLDGGDCGLIVVRDSNREPGDDFAVLAAIDTPRTPGVLAAALRRVPRSLFVNEYTSQPDEIMNCKPSLLPQIAIRAWYYGDRRDEESRAQFARAYSEVGR